MKSIEKGSDSIYSSFAGKVEGDRIKILTSVEPGSLSVSGSGTVATILFEAKENGESEIGFSPETAIVVIKGQNHWKIPFIPEDGKVLVVPFDRFGLSNIPSPQRTGEGFELVITAFDMEGDTKTTFSGEANLSCQSGAVSPSTITLEKGGWQGIVVINQPPNHGTETIKVECLLVTEKSNPFLILQKDNKEAKVETEEGVILELGANALGTDSIIHIATITEGPEIPTSTIKVGDTLLEVNACDVQGNQLGTESLASPSTITVPYKDYNQDGWVDGSLVWEEELCVLQYGNGIWNSLPSIVDPIRNTVSASLPHLSLFVLQGTETTGSITSFSCDAMGILGKGDTFTATLLGEKRGKAFFSIVGILGTISMLEIENGKYIGTYTIKEADNVLAGTITGYLTISTMTYSMDATTTLTADTTPPQITSITPASGSYVRGTINISLSLSDNISGIGTISLFWGTYSVGNIWDTKGFPEETNDLWLIVCDNARNYATSTKPYPITIDNTKPETPTLISIVNPELGRSLNLSWTQGTDTNLAGYKVYYGTQSGNYPNSLDTGTIATEYQLGSLTNGVCYYITISAYDKAGNEGNKSKEGIGTPTGQLARMKIEIATLTITTDGSLTLCLKGYDDAYSLIGYILGTFSITPNLGSFNPIYGTKTIFDPVKTGIGTITATDGTHTDTITITIEHGTITALSLEPRALSISADSSLTITAIAQDADGNTWTTLAELSTNDPWGTISGNIYYPGKAGTWTITGTTTNGIIGTATVMVTSGVFTKFTVNAPATTTINATFTLFVSLTDNDGNPYLGTISLNNTTNSIFPKEIFASQTTIATITKSLNKGEDTITASYGAVRGIATITVYIKKGAILEIQSQYGTINLIETGSLTDDFIVCITDAKDYSTFTTTNKPDRGIGICIDVRLINPRKEEFHKGFTIRVEVPYSHHNLGNIAENTLRLYTFNEQTNKWEGVLNSWVDPINNIINGTLTHLCLIAPCGSSTFADNNTNAYCYPNPWRKGRYIWFDQVSEGSTIKIYNIFGELIDKINVEECPQRWNVLYKGISSGVYIYTITGGKGGKKIGKIGIIK
ncbi:MAG: fibronectin type III domain-containing protein [bacterium]